MTQEDQKIICPDCKNEVKREESMAVGDIVECEECGTELEILSLTPLKYSELIEEK